MYLPMPPSWPEVPQDGFFIANQADDNLVDLLMRMQGPCMLSLCLVEIHASHQALANDLHLMDHQ